MTFLALAVILFAASPVRVRVYLISVLSIVFYATWRWDFVFLVILSAGVDFIAALMIHRRDKQSRQRVLILLSALAINIGILIFFKYTQFLYDSVYNASLLIASEFNFANPVRPYQFDILLPIGISFYTFQSISYTVDVYRRNTKPTRNFFVFFAYVSFWPQLVAGPILRAAEIIPQLQSPKNPSPELFLSGLQRVAIGLAKKVVVADTLALLVDRMFAHSIEEIGALPASEIFLMAFLFGLQIYMDFSAYSDIAIGSAAMVGIRFPENFSWPYMARSPREFWQRWHISLSSWIRDYVYLPLLSRPPSQSSRGGLSLEDDAPARNRRGALLLTWIIMGLWHGASWTFAMWGLYHAGLIMVYRGLDRLLGNWKAPFRETRVWREVTWLMTLFPIMLSWLFFRAESTEQLFALIGRLFELEAYLVFSAHRLVYFLVCIGVLVLMRLMHDGFHSQVHKRWIAKAEIRYGCLVVANTVLIFALIVFLRPVNQFIYFQF